MKQQHLKILRYNTGTDKKAFVQFKDFFDAAIFNATIVVRRNIQNIKQYLFG